MLTARLAVFFFFCVCVCFFFFKLYIARFQLHSSDLLFFLFFLNHFHNISV